MVSSSRSIKSIFSPGPMKQCETCRWPRWPMYPMPCLDECHWQVHHTSSFVSEPMSLCCVSPSIKATSFSLIWLWLSAGLLRQLKQVMDFPGNYLGNLWTLVPYLFPETRTAQSRMHVRAASVQSCARSAPTKPWVLDATSCGKEWLRLSKRREQAQRRHGFISKWRSCFSVWSVSKRRPFYKTEHVRHCRIKALTIPPVSHQSPTSYSCSGCAESPTCLDCHVASTGPTNRVPQSKIMLEAQGIWICFKHDLVASGSLEFTQHPRTWDRCNNLWPGVKVRKLAGWDMPVDVRKVQVWNGVSGHMKSKQCVYSSAASVNCPVGGGEWSLFLEGRHTSGSTRWIEEKLEHG